MKSIYYFLNWHWKKYRYEHIDLLPVGLGLITFALILSAVGFKIIGGMILLFAIFLLILSLILVAIVTPIQESYRDYKKEQHEMLNKINYGQEKHDRFKKRN